MAITRAISSEILKTRRSLALWLSILGPLLMAALQFVVFYQRADWVGKQTDDVWLTFGQQTLVFWALLMLPLFITLQTALLAGLDHAGSCWKHLYALPLSRWIIYAAKQLIGMGLIALSMTLLYASILVAGHLLRLLKPQIGFASLAPWLELLRHTALIYLTSWLLISIHTWVGLRWGNFVVAMGFGIAMTVAGMVVINSEWGRYYPWALPGLVANGFQSEEMLPSQVITGVIGGLLVPFVGGWRVTRRDVL